MDRSLIAYVVWSIVWAIVCVWAAALKRRDVPAGWAIGGILFGPLALMVLLFQDTQPRQA
jgi:hypothetical protein